MTIDIQIPSAPQVDPDDLTRLAHLLTVVVSSMLIVPEEDVFATVGQ